MTEVGVDLLIRIAAFQVRLGQFVKVLPAVVEISILLSPCLKHYCSHSISCCSGPGVALQYCPTAAEHFVQKTSAKVHPSSAR